MKKIRTEKILSIEKPILFIQHWKSCAN